MVAELVLASNTITPFCLIVSFVGLRAGPPANVAKNVAVQVGVADCACDVANADNRVMSKINFLIWCLLVHWRLILCRGRFPRGFRLLELGCRGLYREAFHNRIGRAL